MQTLTQILEVLSDARLTDNMSNADIAFVTAMRDLAVHVQRVDAEQRRLRGLITDFDGHVAEIAKLREKLNGLDSAAEALRSEVAEVSNSVDGLQNSLAADREET